MKFQSCLKHHFRNFTIWKCFKLSGSFLHLSLLIAPSSHFLRVSTNIVLVLSLAVQREPDFDAQSFFPRI